MGLISVGVYAIVLLMTYVVHQKQFVLSRCEECEVRYIPSFDDMMILEYRMWTKQAPRQDLCYRLCQLDVPCLSFQYNADTKLCRGFASGFTSPNVNQTSAENGTKLYVTCRATNQMGSACVDAGDCHASANDCVEGICRCSTEFSMHTWSCIKYYHGCFYDDDRRVLDYAKVAWNNMTNEICTDRCRILGYRFAGTEYKWYCFCDNTINPDYPKLPEDRCDHACAGNNQQMCGGDFTISIYAT